MEVQQTWLRPILLVAQLCCEDCTGQGAGIWPRDTALVSVVSGQWSVAVQGARALPRETQPSSVLTRAWPLLSVPTAPTAFPASLPHHFSSS